MTMTPRIIWDPQDRWRLMRVSTDLSEVFGTRTEDGARMTYEWGEPDADGVYEPQFTRHNDDVLGELDAAWKAAEEALPEGWRGPTVGPGYAELGPEHRYMADARDSKNAGGVGAVGPTPAAALLALRDALRERQP